jgi:UDP-glucose 4-epimerase
MRAIVTGGMGFIGSNLVDRLIDDGHSVAVLDNMSTGHVEYGNKSAEFHHVDVCDSLLDYIDLFQGVDVVYHLAAKTNVLESIENPLEYNETNVNGLFNVLDVSRRSGVGRVVFSSSSAIYGNGDTYRLSENNTHPMPISPYGCGKLMGEMHCRMFSEVYGLKTISLRYFNVYGERQPIIGSYCPVISVFARQRLEGHLLTVRGTGSQLRDYVHVSDVVNANLLATINGNAEGGVYNVGTGIGTSVNDVADMIGGETINVIGIKEPYRSIADNSASKRGLGWEPTVDLREWIDAYKVRIGIE